MPQGQSWLEETPLEAEILQGKSHPRARAHSTRRTFLGAHNQTTQRNNQPMEGTRYSERVKRCQRRSLASSLSISSCGAVSDSVWLEMLRVPPHASAGLTSLSERESPGTRCKRTTREGWRHASLCTLCSDCTLLTKRVQRAYEREIEMREATVLHLQLDD